MEPTVSILGNRWCISQAHLVIYYPQTFRGLSQNWHIQVLVQPYNSDCSFFVPVSGVFRRSIYASLAQSKICSVAISTGWSKRYGRIGTNASPVTVGPQVFKRTFFTLTNAFFACKTAVWMVKAGNALIRPVLEIRHLDKKVNVVTWKRWIEK